MPAIYPAIRPAIGGAIASIFDGFGASSLSAQVAALFASLGSTPKLWLDPSDRSTLWQDSAGTTPVVSAADPIGRILDKSGASILATQATTTSRPLWQTTYASFDGVDDFWATPAMDFTSTDKVTVIAGARKLSDAAGGWLVNLNSNNTPSFRLGLPTAVGSTAQFAASLGGERAANGTIAAPVTAVFTGSADNVLQETTLRLNGVVAQTIVASLGAGNFGSAALNVGQRSTGALRFNGNLYGLMIIGRLLTADELSLCERYMAQKSGVTL